MVARRSTISALTLADFAAKGMQVVVTVEKNQGTFKNAYVATLYPSNRIRRRMFSLLRIMVIHGAISCSISQTWR